MALIGADVTDPLLASAPGGGEWWIREISGIIREISGSGRLNRGGTEEHGGTEVLLLPTMILGEGDGWFREFRPFRYSAIQERGGAEVLWRVLLSLINLGV